MVRRLLVTLSCFSFAFCVLVVSRSSEAQDVSAAKPAPVKIEQEIPAKAVPKPSAKSVQETPGKADQETPGKADQETPGKADQETPGKADQETPGKADQETPAKVVPKPSAKADQETPGKTVQETPDKAVQETPAKSVPEPAAKVQLKAPEAKPVEPVVKAPVRPADKNIRSEYLLPGSTTFWLSIPDANLLEKQFDATQFGLMAKDPAIKPFIDGLREQVKELMNDQNVRLGFDVDDLHGVHSGEICLAGVLPELDGKQPAKGSHGLILLIDVSKTEKQARELQKKINDDLVKRGAKQKNFPINGVLVTKSTINNPKKLLRQSQSNFQAVVNGWMLVCDNENIFRDVLRRLAAPQKIQKAETLSTQAAFKSVMEHTDLKEFDAHIRWFIDPFGYIDLAQAIEDEERANREKRDDWAKILKDQGFSAFQGIGGNISVATTEHEILHKTFTFAPREQTIKNRKRIFELFDFYVSDKPLAPADWVPADCGAFVTGNWEMTKALKSVGGLYDAFLDEEGAFKRMLNDFKIDPDMQLDINKLVGLVDNRLTIISATERPITESSERVVIGFPIKGEPQFVFDSINRGTRGKVIDLGGIKVIEADSTDEDLGGDLDDEFSLPGEVVEEEAESNRAFALFQKRYFVVHKGFLLVANNKNFLKKLLAQKRSELSEAADYVLVKETLGKLTDEKKISWRQFGRIDRTMETNYEMIRRGEMGKSQTVLARVVNQIFAKHAAEKAAAEGKKVDDKEMRKQKLDGSKLPADYEKSIAPYFGPMGWVMETEKDGWRITGCVLKKKGMTEVVQKVPDDEENGAQQR